MNHTSDQSCDPWKIENCQTERQKSRYQSKSCQISRLAILKRWIQVSSNQAITRSIICLALVPIFIPSMASAVVSDVQVNTLISQAIRTHPLVGSAQSEQKATQEGITASKLNMLPSPSISTGYDSENELVSRLTIRQPLWTGGRLTANVNQAVFDDKAAVEHIYEQQNQVAKNTIEAWKSYITAVAMQRVHLKNLDQFKQFEGMMNRRVNQGISARIELDVLNNRILQEQKSYQAAKEQQRIATARLEQIIGQSIQQSSALSLPELDVMVRDVKRQASKFEKLVFNQASFYNPTVVKERYQIESAKQEWLAQQAVKYPNVYAQYDYQYYHKDKKDDSKFSLGMNYEPGAGFSNFALSRASQARVDSLIQSQEASRRTVLENIQTQYQQFASAKDKESSVVAAVAGANIVVGSYQRQFIAGRKSWLEVLNAVRELGDYEIQLVGIQADILGSFYKLQVDFGLMPWQQFQQNRQPTPLYHPLTPVRQWIKDQKEKSSFGFPNVTLTEEDEE